MDVRLERVKDLLNHENFLNNYYLLHSFVLMKKKYIILVPVLVVMASLLGSCSKGLDQNTGETEILKWKDGKSSAVSLTYDDGSINQFRVALPLMEEQGFPGTFFINTGRIPGSEFKARFIGRPVEEIIEETAEVPTNLDNLFERASAVGYLGYRGLMDYHTRAGSSVDAGNMERACEIIDEAYAKVRAGNVQKRQTDDGYFGEDHITWDEIREFASRGYEFASHTISHPRLAILDEVNMLWELEKCKEDILRQLGSEHTFSCECPYGTENERVMDYALAIYPATRNRMPEEYLAELNRGSRVHPSEPDKPYVQWQRGPKTATPLHLMNSWIDTCLVNNDIWLVLGFHGVDAVGWEAIPGDTLDTFFSYIKANEEELWVATFQDVTKYMRERMSSTVKSSRDRDQIQVNLSQNLDQSLYNLPLTLKTEIPDRWKEISVTQNGMDLDYEIISEKQGRSVMYSALPGEKPVIIKSVM
jgi:peptidoglycan/xylan/chitin deacetylase (PgdA/CDA1 family)